MFLVKESKLHNSNQYAIHLFVAEFILCRLRSSLILIQERYLPAQHGWSRNARTNAPCINVHPFP